MTDKRTMRPGHEYLEYVSQALQRSPHNLAIVDQLVMSLRDYLTDCHHLDSSDPAVIEAFQAGVAFGLSVTSANGMLPPAEFIPWIALYGFAATEVGST